MGHTINDPIIVFTAGEVPTMHDWTADVASATFDTARPIVSRPMFGDGGDNLSVKGRFTGNLALDFNHDYDTGKITQTLWAWLIGDDLIDVAVRAKDAPIGADNPEWTFKIAVDALPVVDGGAGELATGSITLRMHGVPAMNVTPAP